MADIVDRFMGRVLDKAADAIVKGVSRALTGTKQKKRTASAKPAKRVSCPVCGKTGLKKLANHRAYCSGKSRR